MLKFVVEKQGAAVIFISNGFYLYTYTLLQTSLLLLQFPLFNIFKNEKGFVECHCHRTGLEKRLPGQ